MMIRSLPEAWTVQTNEISANVYRVIARAADGRRIESTATESELDRVTQELVDSVHDSDRQIAERLKQTR